MCYAIDAMNHHPDKSPAAAMDAHYDCAGPADSADAVQAAPITGDYVPTLEDWQREVYENNVAHGWFDEGRSFAMDVALLHSEVSEMLEADRQWGSLDMTHLSPVEHTSACTRVVRFRKGEPEQSCPCGGLRKPEGVGSEMADVLIRLLDTAQRTGIDLRAEYEQKMAYNRTRPIKHGKKAY